MKKNFESLYSTTQGNMKDSHIHVHALSDSKHIVYKPCLFVGK